MSDLVKSQPTHPPTLLKKGKFEVVRSSQLRSTSAYCANLNVFQASFCFCNERHFN